MQEEERQCSVCLEDFEQDDSHQLLPRIYPCQAHHSFCSACINKLEFCPLCGSESQDEKRQMSSYSPNLAMVQLLKLQEWKASTNKSSFYLGVALAGLSAYTTRLLWRCYYSKWSAL